jgi:hypothetical protein
MKNDKRNIASVVTISMRRGGAQLRLAAFDAGGKLFKQKKGSGLDSSYLSFFG